GDLGALALWRDVLRFPAGPARGGLLERLLDRILALGDLFELLGRFLLQLLDLLDGGGPDLSHLGDPGKLRALLKRVNVEVRVYWRRVTEQDRAARRKGRGHGCPGKMADWVVDKARLKVEIFCGSSAGQNASEGCRVLSGRGCSRRRASPGPAGSP